MNAVELREEMEGSKLDIREACESVNIHYYHATQPWMQQPVQAAFIIHIKPSTLSSPAPPTTTVPPLLLYAGAAMPHGYRRIHLTAGSPGEAVVESTAFSYDGDATCYPTLNGLLMRHSVQYRHNKEDELTRKLTLLAAAPADEGDGDEGAEQTVG